MSQTNLTKCNAIHFVTFLIFKIVFNKHCDTALPYNVIEYFLAKFNVLNFNLKCNRKIKNSYFVNLIF